MPIEYAHALSHSLETTTSDTEAAERVDALIGVLKSDGKMRALPGILREFERIQARKSSRKPTLVTAQEADTADALKKLKDQLPSASEVETSTDERLVGGWRYSDGDTLIDASYKKALLELYRRVTAL